MKYEWRKLERDFYSTKKKPVILNIPKQKFISLSGTGNPNGPEFSQKIQILYPAAYGIKGLCSISVGRRLVIDEKRSATRLFR